MVSDQHDMSAAHAGNKLLRWSLHAKAATNVTRKTTSSSPTNLRFAAEIDRQRQQTAEAPAWNQQRCLKGQKQWIVQTSWAPLAPLRQTLVSPSSGELICAVRGCQYEYVWTKHTKRNDWESKDRMTYCMSSFRRKHLMRQVPKTWPPSLRNIKAKKD